MSEVQKVAHQFYHGGADSDTSPEFLDTQKGRYRDAYNMRLSSVSGQRGSLEKIGGEAALYTTYSYPPSMSLSPKSLDGYTCIGMVYCKGQVVCFWAVSGGDPCVTVDGKLVAESSEIGFSYNHPLQVDVNESCVGGEVFPTDNNVTPKIFNVQNMLDCWGSSTLYNTYFSDYNDSVYSSSLRKQNDVPIFLSLNASGVAVGLKAGQYAYAMRFVDASGNRTAWSQSTNLIPVPHKVATGNVLCNPSKNGVGGVATTIEGYTITIRFRVTNFNNYLYVELRRVYWNANTGLGFVPTPEYIKVPRDLSPGEMFVYDFTDDSSRAWLPLSDDEESRSLAGLKRAKSVRYYNNRLVYGNIGYYSKDIENNSTISLKQSSYGRYAYPFVNEVGVDGFADPYNFVNNRPYATGERYSFGLVAFDSQGERSFTKEIISGFKFPDRRDEAVGETVSISRNQWKGMPKSVCSDNATINYNHEVFAFRDSSGVFDHETGYAGVQRNTSFTKIGIATDSGYSYEPLRPKNQDDNTDDRELVDPLINEGCGPFWGDSIVSFYSPKYYSPTYYANGLAVHGVENIDPWVSSFSIVRSQRARRVIAQGIAFFKLDDSVSGSLSKSLSTVVFYSDDVFTGYAQDAFEASAGKYKMQLVSPLGWFAEHYDGDYMGATADRNFDVLLKACLYHVKRGNGLGEFPLNLKGPGGVDDFWTYFNGWRGNSGAANDGSAMYDISSVSALKSYEGVGRVSHFYEVSLAGHFPTIWQYQYKNHMNFATDHMDGAGRNNWDEPVFIVNIVADDAVVPDNNIDNYFFTGHHQKVYSYVKRSTGSDMSVQLVDERWDDCIPPYMSNGDTSVVDAVFNSFVQVEDQDNKNPRYFLNVTHKTEAQIKVILDDIDSAGFHVATWEGSETVNVYGIYRHVVSGNDYYLEFKVWPDTATVQYSSYETGCMVPPAGYFIVVTYDDRRPIKVFGGDSWVGESVFCPVDGKVNDTGDTSAGCDVLKCRNGWPFPRTVFSNKYDILKNAPSGTHQSINSLQVGSIRQMVVQFTCESFVANPLFYNVKSTGTDAILGVSDYQAYPRINYVQRPHAFNDSNWEKNFDSDGGAISKDYATDFPGEAVEWYWGGFKYLIVNNFDYSQWRSDVNFTTVPEVGYVDVTDYCSRLIWSSKRVINQQDSPNLKTFPALNSYDISDRQGEVKFLFSGISDRGDNLYAFTDSGVCLLLTEKNVLSDVNATQLAFFSQSNTFIGNEIWVSRDVGMKGECWRSAAEYKGSISWCNDMGVYNMLNSNVREISREWSYQAATRPTLNSVGGGYSVNMCGGFDRLRGEYVLCVGGVNGTLEAYDEVDISGDYTHVTALDYLVVNVLSAGSRLDVVHVPGAVPAYAGLFSSTGTYYFVLDGTQFVEVSRALFSREMGSAFVANIEDSLWHGKYDRYFEKFCSSNNSMYGARDGVVYILDSGYTVMGEGVVASVSSCLNLDQPLDKEAISIGVGSVVKPTRVDFAGSFASLPECSLYSGMSSPANPYYLKDYGKWTNKVPRKLSGSRDRLQGRVVAFEVTHSSASAYSLVDSVVNYKVLKLQL